MAKKSNPVKRVYDKFLTFFRPDQIEDANKQFKTFVDVPEDDPFVETFSVVDDAVDKLAQGGIVGYNSTSSYKNLVYGRIPHDKPMRLKFYRNMAFFPEVHDAIDEICDACVNFDENEKFVNLICNDKDLTEDQKLSLVDEFENFISLFDIENDGWNYFYDLIVDGELAFENLMDENKKDLGIVGVKRIPTDSFEYLIDINMNIVGLLVNARIIFDKTGDVDKIDIKRTLNDVNDLRDTTVKHVYAKRGKSAIIPFHINQVTLINSGKYNLDKTISYPYLESARRAYRQLSLIEDAIIIYRLVRAPERLVFNIDTGSLPPSKAEEMVFKMMKRYQNKKVYDPATGSVVNDYDPHQMIENYFFPKMDGSSGSTVNTLQSGQSLGNLEDLQYFLRKLYLSLKVPFDRFSEQPIPVEKSETISYEEYRFGKFVMRIQQQFAKGLFHGFITHLKLIGLWEKFKLNKRSCKIVFTKPTNFDLYEQQRLINLRMDNFNKATEHEMFSKDLAAIKYLKMSEHDLAQNYKYVESEMLRAAYLNRKVDSISEYGTPYGADVAATTGAGAEGELGGGGLGDIGLGNLGGGKPEAGGEVNATPEGGAKTEPEAGGEETAQPEGEF